MENESLNTREQAKIILKLMLENGSSLQLGSKWNLISSKWWNMWKSVTNYEELESNSENILNAHNQISATENGENSSIVSVEPINNLDILESNEQTLSPSKRKRDDDTLLLKSQLVENINYVLVPQKVWKLLQSW